MKRCIFCLASLLICTTASTQETNYTAQLGTGVAFGPSSFYLVGSGEYKITPLFSIGPMIQAGIRNHFSAIIPTANFRLTIPCGYDKIKASFVNGFGWMNREVFGTSFNHFDYVLGIQGDYLITNRITAGAGFHWNITSSNIQRTYGALFAQASYRF